MINTINAGLPYTLVFSVQYNECRAYNNSQRQQNGAPLTSTPPTVPLDSNAIHGKPPLNFVACTFIRLEFGRFPFYHLLKSCSYGAVGDVQDGPVEVALSEHTKRICLTGKHCQSFVRGECEWHECQIGWPISVEYSPPALFYVAMNVCRRLLSSTGDITYYYRAHGCPAIVIIILASETRIFPEEVVGE